MQLRSMACGQCMTRVDRVHTTGGASASMATSTPTRTARCDSRSHRGRPNLDGSSCATSARRVEDQGPDPHPMSPSGERRLPFAVHPVLFFGSHRAVQVRLDVAIEAVAPPVVWTLSTRVAQCPQAIDRICIDQPAVFLVVRCRRDNGAHALASQ